MQIRLTSVQRKLLSRTFFIGAVLTMVVVAVDRTHPMQAFERYLYDNRAYFFQRFRPPPSTQIIHISIDDASLNELGRWPWPRTTIAKLVQEISAAGPKVISLDMIMPEADAPTWEPVDLDHKRFEKFDHDRILAETFRAAGNVLVPASAGEFRKTEVSRIYADMVRVIEQDLEQSTDDIQAGLIAAGHKPEEAEAAIQEELLLAFRQAMFQRMRAEMSSGKRTLDEIKAAIAPKATASGQRTDTILDAERLYDRLRSFEALRRFTQPLPTGVPLLAVVPHMAQPPIAILAEAATHSGYVEFLQFDDGVVRTVPLITDFGGRALPHMALATACAWMGVPFSEVKIETDRIIIPRPDAPAIEVPVRTIQTAMHGSASTFLDLSWFGDRTWWSMYDPELRRPLQQESLKNIWRVEQLRQSIARNEEIVLRNLLIVNNLTGIEQEDALRQSWAQADSPGRMATLQRFLDHEVVQQFKQILAEAKPEELNPDDREFLDSASTMAAVIERNNYLAGRIDEERARLREMLSGKIVLVGWTAAGQYDYYPTSLHAQCPGVVIQGVALNAILTQHFWRYAPWWISPIVIVLMGAAVTLATAFLPSYRALVATILLAGVYYLFNAVVLFDYLDWIVPLAGALTAAGLVWGILTLYRYIFESAERARITRRFSSYVDPAIVNYYIDDPDRVQLDGESREMTVVFTDLAGFTTISEKLQERTVPLLNEYMARMMPIIRRNRGRWNKFLGDGIMFFYNAPDNNPQHARDAVVTVLEMQRELEEFNKYLFDQQLPKVAMRAGIVTGQMIAGDAGSIGAADPQNVASDYTVLGDNVNLSARLESANKALGSRTLCAEDTIRQMGEGFVYRPMAMLQVVGKTQGVMTYEVLCFEQEATDDIRELAKMTRCVVEHYLNRRFAECVAAAEALQDRFGSSKFTQLYLECARELAAAPPGADFDGTIVLEAK